MNSSAAAIVGIVLGGGFLVAALASTVSRVTLCAFSPWLLHEVRYREHPKAFVALVLFYWLFGLLGLGSGIVALCGGF